ncbi:MAG: hypothetical protein ACYDCI_04710 [Candidatus Limnocylindrales bacterium]
MIRDAVVHLNNEQPLIADLYEMPDTKDVALACTNLRTLDGKRPVFVNDSAARFLFPLQFIRFIEIPLRRRATDPAPDEMLALPGPGSAGAPDERAVESDLEIDEDFLKRIRDI